MQYHTKPFDINQARAGAPVGCKTERNTIEIFKYTERSIFGSIRYGNEEEVVTSWDINGKNDPCLKSDLVMLPLGYCEGKPVFAGDEMFDTDHQTKVRAGPLERDFLFCTWPKPEPKYPETRMSGAQLLDDWMNNQAGDEESFVFVVNSAIKRAIQDGDVFTKQQVTAVLEELRNICLRHQNPLNIRDIVDGTDWDEVLKAGM